MYGFLMKIFKLTFSVFIWTENLIHHADITDSGLHFGLWSRLSSPRHRIWNHLWTVLILTKPFPTAPLLFRRTSASEWPRLYSNEKITWHNLVVTVFIISMGMNFVYQYLRERNRFKIKCKVYIITMYYWGFKWLKLQVIKKCSILCETT